MTGLYLALLVAGVIGAKWLAESHRQK